MAASRLAEAVLGWDLATCHEIHKNITQTAAKLPQNCPQTSSVLAANLAESGFFDFFFGKSF